MLSFASPHTRSSFFDDEITNPGDELILNLQLKEEGGLSASVSRIQAVLSEKTGGTEELLAVFVAVLRAAGLLVRYVR